MHHIEVGRWLKFCLDTFYQFPISTWIFLPLPLATFPSTTTLYSDWSFTPESSELLLPLWLKYQWNLKNKTFHIIITFWHTNIHTWYPVSKFVCMCHQLWQHWLADCLKFCWRLWWDPPHHNYLSHQVTCFLWQNVNVRNKTEVLHCRASTRTLKIFQKF